MLGGSSLPQNGLVHRSGCARDEGLKWPMDLTSDAQGQIWIADAGLQTVLKWSSASGLTRPFVHLQLQMPHGRSLWPDGSVYVAEMRANRISRVDPEGRVSTVWDQGLLKPAAVLWEPTGLWVADLGNHRVLRLALSTPKSPGD